MQVIELRQIVRIHGRRVAGRLGDEDHRAVLHGKAPGAAAIGLDNVASVADADASDARLACISQAVLIQILENCSASSFSGDRNRQGDKRYEQTGAKVEAGHGVSPSNTELRTA